MNNEPVAWMELYFGEPNNLAWTNAELKDSGDVYKTIPLYTHPAKTLTDEEIHNLMDEIEVLVHGDIKRAMYRMARKVESILNE